MKKNPTTLWSGSFLFRIFVGEMKGLIIFIGDILQDILHGAVQNAAKVIQGFGGDVFVVFQPVKGAVGKSVLCCESVPVFRRLLQCFPEGGVIDHNIIPFCGNVFFILTKSIKSVLKLEYLL